MAGAVYEIHVRGQLPPGLLAKLGGATEIQAPDETVLLTAAVDQEGLHDLIARLESLGLELMELRRTAEGTTLRR